MTKAPSHRKGDRSERPGEVDGARSPWRGSLPTSDDMAPPVVDASLLSSGAEPALAQLWDSLAHWGFARLQLPAGGAALWALQSALDEMAAAAHFRFPPVEGPTRYSDAQRASFIALFQQSRAVLGALLGYAPPLAAAAPALTAALREAPAYDEALFSSPPEAPLPFASERQPFASSFFNLFNYDHGLLNTHKDRCLVTLAYRRRAAEATASALWIQDRGGRWWSSDALLGERELLVLIGEELEALAEQAGCPLYAAPHAVRVDPTGPHLERAHHRPDPATPPRGNRVSAALILSHELREEP